LKRVVALPEREEAGEFLGTTLLEHNIGLNLPKDGKRLTCLLKYLASPDLLSILSPNCAELPMEIQSKPQIEAPGHLKLVADLLLQRMIE
jgi:hypothetical protein